MATIHRKAGSTQYLLDKVPEMNGSKLETLSDIQQFYENYETILKQVEATAKQQIEAEIAQLEQEEKILGDRLEEGTSSRRKEIDNKISELRQEIQTTTSLIKKFRNRMAIVVETSFKEMNVGKPYRHIKSEFDRKHNQRLNLVTGKESLIRIKCKSFEHSYKVIEENKTFYIGAFGEEEVIEALSRLPSEYHVINDVKLHFHQAIYWKKGNEHISNCQIDHIVIGPTGLYLIETKNWSFKGLEDKRDELVHQIQRANYALWFYMKNVCRLNDDVKIRSVAVSIHGDNQRQKIDDYIDMITPYMLYDYVLKRKEILTSENVNSLVKILSGRSLR